MSEYTDMKNNTYRIIQHIHSSTNNKEQLENEIVEELYNIFASK